jgi:hypothetical protein
MSWTCLRCETLNGDNDFSCEVCDLERLYTRQEVEAVRSTSGKAHGGRRASRGWYAFLALGLIAGAVLLGLYGQLREEQAKAAALRGELERLETQQAELRAELKQERDLRQRISLEWPVSLTELRTSSSPVTAAVQGLPGSFYGTLARYIYFHTTLINNQPEIQQVQGRLCVRYYDPSGTLKTGQESSQGCTFWEDVDMTASLEIGVGWGNAALATYTSGRHRIELWWQGKLIGQTSFDIY